MSDTSTEIIPHVRGAAEAGGAARFHAGIFPNSRVERALMAGPDRVKAGRAGAETMKPVKIDVGRLEAAAAGG